MALSKPSDIATAKALTTVDGRLSALERNPLLQGNLLDVEFTDELARVPHRLKRPYRGFLSCGGLSVIEDETNPQKDKEIWLKRAQSPVLLDHVLVTSDTGLVTFSDLKGDTDRIYRIDFQVIHADRATDDVILLRPNGVTTTVDGQRHWAVDATTGETDATGMALSWWGDNHAGICYFFAETGTWRHSISMLAADNNVGVELCGGVWTDTTTEVTSLEIFSASSVIGAGSQFWLYALAPRATKTKVWVF